MNREGRSRAQREMGGELKRWFILKKLRIFSEMRFKIGTIGEGELIIMINCEKQVSGGAGEIGEEVKGVAGGGVVEG